jgi:hypothetical protein
VRAALRHQILGERAERPEGNSLQTEIGTGMHRIALLHEIALSSDF